MNQPHTIVDTDMAAERAMALDVDKSFTPATDYELDLEARVDVLEDALDLLGNEIEAMQSAYEELEAATDALLKAPEGADIWSLKLDRAEALGLLKAHISSVVSVKRTWVGE